MKVEGKLKFAKLSFRRHFEDLFFPLGWLQTPNYSLLEQQLVSCPTHSAPSVSCVIRTEQDVSVDDSRHVLSTSVQQENTADKNLVNPTILGLRINYISEITLSFCLLWFWGGNASRQLTVCVNTINSKSRHLLICAAPLWLTVSNLGSKPVFQQNTLHHFWQATATFQTWYNWYQSIKKCLVRLWYRYASGHLSLYSLRVSLLL